MPISKDTKRQILDTLRKIAKEAKNITFVNFHGLAVSDVNAVRRELRMAGVGYLVAKKTLIRKAFEEGTPKGAMPPLEGEVGIAWSADPLAPSREAGTFERKLAGAWKLIGGVFEGRFLGQEEIRALAAIPPREMLLAQFVNIIHSPIRRFAVAVSEIAKKRGS